MIPQSEYNQRRVDLAKKLPQNSIAVIPGNREYLRNGDSHYRFRQSSFFYYLTGFNEPDAVILIESNGDSYLFNNPSDLKQEQWTGTRLGQADAPEILGVNAAYPINQINTYLPDFFYNRSEIYYTFGYDQHWDSKILEAYQKTQGRSRKGVYPPRAFCDIYALISEMRLFKSSNEIKCMQLAAELSVGAHNEILHNCKNMQYEYELEAIFLNYLNKNGCRNVAYESIIASGKNACILHYTNNNQILDPNALVLIDAGGEMYNYASDITRTYPTKGIFSPEQKMIYEVVLHAQKQAISLARPGTPWELLQQTIIYHLTNGLLNLNILSGNLDSLIEQKAYQQFYMHGSGHWLGLDVHDCGDYKLNNTSRLLEPGMALTIEPGLYLSPNADLDPRWWNIGVRIEDDFIINSNGHDCLSAKLCSNIEDIEAILRG